MEVMTLDKLDFRSYSIEKKREAFISLDIMMKSLHERNMMAIISKEDPTKDIAYENGIYYFTKIVPIDSRNANSKEDAVYRNVMYLANLALCMYIPESDFASSLKVSLLDFGTIFQYFEKYKVYFPTGDANYYESILVNAYKDSKLPDIIYYTDYLNNKSKDLNGNNNGMVMLKATAIGKAWAKEDEAAFTNTFLLLISVLSITVASIIGIIFLGLRF